MTAKFVASRTVEPTASRTPGAGGVDAIGGTGRSRPERLPAVENRNGGLPQSGLPAQSMQPGPVTGAQPSADDGTGWGMQPIRPFVKLLPPWN